MGASTAFPALAPATDAQTRAQTASSVGVSPLNLAGKAAFKATLSANQTLVADTTFTKVAFNTEAYDIGALYDNATNYRWVPPAGRVQLTFRFSATGTWAAGNTVLGTIYKNNARFADCSPASSITANASTGIVTVDDSANGTDYYEAFVYIDVDSGTATVAGGVLYSSHFSGSQI